MPHVPTTSAAFALPPGATEVVLVRHGASPPAVPGEPFPLLDGHGDPPLAPEGEAQADCVAERLARRAAARGLFVTPLQRTRADGRAARGACSASSRSSCPSCARSTLGEWEGGEFRIRMAEGDPIAIQAVAEERWEVIPGAETMEALAARVRAGHRGRRRRRGARRDASPRSCTAA